MAKHERINAPVMHRIGRLRNSVPTKFWAGPSMNSIQRRREMNCGIMKDKAKESMIRASSTEVKSTFL